MNKILRSAITIAVTTVSLSAAAQQSVAPLISNYGYTNLTYGYGQADRQGTMTHREELLVDGVMHVMWVQQGALEEDYGRLYEAWYRRSDDLGKTWSEPVCVADHLNNVATGDKMMNVEDGTVHIVARATNYHLWYFRSQMDGSFKGKELMAGSSRADEFRSYVVGGQMAIAYYNYGASDTYYIFSRDGENFITDKVVDDVTPYANQCFLKDFTFDGKRMAMLYNGSSGAVEMYVSDDLGHSWNRSVLSPVFKDDEGRDVYHGGAFHWWRNGGLDHPVPQIAMAGDKLYATFYTRMPDGGEEEYVVLARSLDGGKTWLPLTKITDDFRNYNAQLMTRGENVYVTFDNADYHKRGVCHSHDGGATFEIQNSWGFALTSQFNAYAQSIEIYVDDNDPTGQTAYLLFNDYGYIKTIDGFRTVCEVNSNGNRYTDDRVVHLLVDAQGLRHWFIDAQDAADKYLHYINYRREGDDPQSTWADYALHITPSNDWAHMNYASIHNTWETMPDRELTVEMWAKAEGSVRFAQVWSGGDSGYEAWKVGSYVDWTGKTSYEVDLRNYADGTAGLRSAHDWEPGIWHHVAFTYSESASEARLYVDGVLADTKPMSGTLRYGRLPIMLGGADPGHDFYMDDFRLWNRPLSADEIALNYAAKAAGKSFTSARGLMVNYTFNRSLHDMSSHGHHAIPVGNIEFEGFDPAGIHAVTAKHAEGCTYDLQGRKAAAGAKGVVVKEGRKELVK